MNAESVYNAILQLKHDVSRSGHAPTYLVIGKSKFDALYDDDELRDKIKFDQEARKDFFLDMELVVTENDNLEVI